MQRFEVIQFTKTKRFLYKNQYKYTRAMNGKKRYNSNF